MQSLKDFQEESRTWLEENGPQSMRTAMVQEEIVWGGRDAEFANPMSCLTLVTIGKEKGFSQEQGHDH